MRAAWRLARSICSARLSRALLLTAAVTMSTALVAAVACAMASLDAALRNQIESAMGTAEVRVQPAGGETMPVSLAETVRAWPGVERIDATLETTLALVATMPTLVEQPDDSILAEDREYRVNAFVRGVDLAQEFEARPPKLIAGRLPVREGEVLIDAALARRLSFVDSERRANGQVSDALADPTGYLDSPLVAADSTASDSERASKLNEGVGVRIGDRLRVVRTPSGLRALFARPEEVGTLIVVGISEAPPLGGKPTAIAARAEVESLANLSGMISLIEIELDQGVEPGAFVTRHAPELDERVLIQTTERITSGVEKNLAASQLGLVLVGSVALLCAGFIIMTGLTTGVAEQQRTLAVLRCVGARRSQLAGAQLLAGSLVGVAGGILGVPIGIALTWVLTLIFERQLPEGLRVPPVMLSIVVTGALAAGLLGALWPAWRAASLSPLQALSARSRPAGARGIGVMLMIGLLLVSMMIGMILFIENSQVFFWSYAMLGLPAMFIGYFVVSVPVIVGVSTVAGPVLARVLRLPPALLVRTVRATPYRHGFTAGALMTGLALMVGIWTNGGSALQDWVGKIKFPDAFAAGLSISPEAEGVIAALPEVRRTTPITMTVVEVDTFGVRGLSEYKTQFFGLDFATLSDMFEVQFAEGDRETAIQRLDHGGAVIIAREFQAAQGLGVGDTFSCTFNGQQHDFEIVGVVLSPGLEFISQFFDFGASFVNQTVSSVVGSRADAEALFGATRPMVIGIQLEDGVDEAAAVSAVSEATLGTGVLNVGSGKRIREQIEVVVGTTLTVFTTVAIGAMLVACFGVANLIIAEVQSRRFEFGVIRAVGGSRGQLIRLVCGQAIIIGIGASILGTLLGIQSAWGGQTVNTRIVGIDLTVRPPVGAIAFGWGVAITMALLAAAPTAWRLGRASPRVLLSARG